jgi:hypothetical protein
MAVNAIVCPSCGSTDLFVLSLGVVFRGGAILEVLSWTEGDQEDSSPHYHVEEEVLSEPEPAETEGPVKALCASCLADLTARYLEMETSRPPQA